MFRFFVPMKIYYSLSKTALFIITGECDPVVPYKFGQLSHYSLKSFMKSAQFTSYPGMSHTSSQQEMDDIKVCFTIDKKKIPIHIEYSIDHNSNLKLQDFIEKHVPQQ